MGAARSVKGAEAVEIILGGAVAEGLTVEDHLDLGSLVVDFALPRGLRVAGDLTLTGSAVRELPDDLQVGQRVYADRCGRLARVGPGVRAESLDLSHCRGLRRLEGPPQVEQLILEGCIGLESLPAGLRCRNLVARGCLALASLPADMKAGVLDVRGCTRLRSVPPDRAEVVLVDRRSGVPYAWSRLSADEDTARHWASRTRAKRSPRVQNPRRRIDIGPSRSYRREHASGLSPPGAVSARVRGPDPQVHARDAALPRTEDHPARARCAWAGSPSAAGASREAPRQPLPHREPPSG
jgi:hypothetical protein